MTVQNNTQSFVLTPFVVAEDSPADEDSKFFADLPTRGYRLVGDMMVRVYPSGYYVSAEAWFFKNQQLTHAHGLGVNARHAYERLMQQIRQVTHFGSVDAALNFALRRRDEKRLRRLFADAGEDVQDANYATLRQMAGETWTLTQGCVKWGVL